MVWYAKYKTRATATARSTMFREPGRSRLQPCFYSGGSGLQASDSLIKDGSPECAGKQSAETMRESWVGAWRMRSREALQRVGDEPQRHAQVASAWREEAGHQRGGEKCEHEHLPYKGK